MESKRVFFYIIPIIPIYPTSIINIPINHLYCLVGGMNGSLLLLLNPRIRAGPPELSEQLEVLPWGGWAPS